MSIATRRSLLTCFVFISCLTLLGSGCASSEPLVTGPTPEEIETAKLRTSIDLLRNSLAETARERNGFQDALGAATSELESLRLEMPRLETSYRLRLNEVQDYGARLAAAEQGRALEAARSKEAERGFQALTASSARLQERFDEVQRASNALRVQFEQSHAEATKLRADLVESQVTIGSLSKERNSLPEVVTQQLAELRGQVASLSAELEKARKAAGAHAGSGDSATGSGASQTSAASFLAGWSKRSIGSLVRGEFDKDSILFATVTFVFLFTTLGCFVRFRRAAGSAAPAVADSGTGALPRSETTFAGPPSGTVRLPSPRTGFAGANEVSAMLDERLTPAVERSGQGGSVAIRANRSAKPKLPATEEGIPNSAGDATIVIRSDVPRGGGNPTAPRVPQRPAPVAGNAAEDELLTDLKRLIQENFQGDKK